MPEQQLRCPACHEMTHDLKSYRLVTFLLFLFVGASFNHAQITACPPCMRKRIGKLTLINLLPANLLWLILLLPWYSVAALLTFTRGHSKKASAALEPASPQYRSASGPSAFASLATGKEWERESGFRGYLSGPENDVIDAGFLLLHISGQPVERLPVRLLKQDGSCYRASLLQASVHEPGLHAGLEVFVKSSTSHPPVIWVPPAAAANLEHWTSKCDSCQFDLLMTPVLELARRANPGAQPGYEPSPMMDICASCGGVINTKRTVSRAFGAPLDDGPEPRPGTGPVALNAWRIAVAITAVIGLLGVGLAGASSETAGVEAALLVFPVIGFVLGGWRGVIVAQRTDRGWPWVLLAAVLALFAVAALTFLFFFGIFPSL